MLQIHFRHVFLQVINVTTRRMTIVKAQPTSLTHRNRWEIPSRKAKSRRLGRKANQKKTGFEVIMFCFQVAVSRCYFRVLFYFHCCIILYSRRFPPMYLDHLFSWGWNHKLVFAGESSPSCTDLVPFPKSIELPIACKLTGTGYVELMLTVHEKIHMCFQKRKTAELAAFSHPEDEDWEIHGDKEYLGLSFGVLTRASPDRVSTRWEIQPATCGLACINLQRPWLHQVC